jgi:hypothetical protein
MQEQLDLVWAHLLPAFRDAPLPAGTVDQQPGDELLAERLARLSTARVTASEPGPGGPLELSPTSAAEPFVRRIERVRIEPLPRGTRLVLTVRGENYGFDIPPGEFADGVLGGLNSPFPEVSVSAGWVSGDEYHAEIVSRRTPHRLRLRVGPAADGQPALSVGWQTPPLAL